jgi:MFS transporter, PPP family, 3-phenylpropionic acid transporter
MAIFYAAFFAFAGIQMPYLPVWFESKGLDVREIGIVLAVPMLIRVVAVPFATRLIDRRFAHRAALVVAAALSTAGYAIMGMAFGFVAILVAYTAISIVYSPMLPLADSYGLRGRNARGLAYGPVRLWGSVAFIGANFGGGALLAALGPGNVVWALTATMAVAATVTLLLPATPDDAKRATKPADGRGLWGSRLFVTIVVAASLVQASHAVMYGFVSLQWSAKGLDGTMIGALWAIGVVAEILLFAVSGRLIAKFGAVEMILLGSLGAIVRWTTMAFDPPVALLPVLQCLHGLSFGATHLGAMHVLSRLAARGATAQGDFAAFQGITFAAAMGMSGMLVERFGSYAYLAMSLAAGLGFLTAIAGRQAWGAASRA